MENNYLNTNELIHNIQPIIKGTNKTLVMTFYTNSQQDELFSDLIDAEITFGLRKNQNSNSNLFNKVSSDISEVLIIGTSQLKIFLDPIDTQNLTSGLYFGELIVLTAGTSTYKVYMNIPIV